MRVFVYVETQLHRPCYMMCTLHEDKHHIPVSTYKNQETSKVEEGGEDKNM